jgi:phosphoglycolate phosphatase
MSATRKRTEPAAPALVLFDIDGTLIRKAGPHHRQALVEAVQRVTGIETTTDNVPVQGMLDRDILGVMLRNAGAHPTVVRQAMPELIRQAQSIYVSCCPNLERKVCPGVRKLLLRLLRRGIPTGLVTGNLTLIGWKKMEHAGLRHYFRFGAFAEQAHDRAGLVRIAIRQARREGWIDRHSRVSLVGDHPNDVLAAKANQVQSIAVATGLSPAAELAEYAPDILVDDLRSLSFEALVA